MIKQTKLKEKITYALAISLLGLFMLPTLAVFVPTTSSKVNAALDCKSKYIAYRQTGNDNSGHPHEVWESCLRGLAIEWCGSRDHWQEGNQSDEFKKNTCINWYELGFNNPRGTVCTTSKDPSGNNKKTCQQAAGTSLNYAAAYEQTKEDGTPREDPRDSATNGGNGGGGAGGAQNGGNVDPAPTVKQKELPESDDPALECVANTQTNNDCDLVAKYVNPIITFLSAFVGIAVTIGIISGGIRYASASDDPQKSAAGRQMIRNSLIALVAYIFLFALIKWLIPQVAP